MLQALLLSVAAVIVAVLLPPRCYAYQKTSALNHRNDLTSSSHSRYTSLHLAEGGSSPAETALDASAKEGVGKAKKTRAKKEIDSRSEKEKTGLVYRDNVEEYDVPLLKTPMWFKVSVRKNSELKLAEHLIAIRDGTTDDSTNDRFKRVIADSFCPVQPVLKFKGKQLAYSYKPMLPGLIFVKCKMSPDIADFIESIRGVSGMGKNRHGFSVPADEETGAELEAQKARSTKTPTAAQLLIRKGEYVEVVDGQFRGRNGIVQGVDQGKLSVLLRSETEVDTLMSFELRDVRYLANPPNDVNKMTVKDAVESLMAKNPKHPMLNALRKDGHLEAILYPGGRDEDSYSWKEREERDMQSRGSGKRIRSIAKEDNFGGYGSRDSSSSSDAPRKFAARDSADDFDDFFKDSSFSSKAGSSGGGSKNGAPSNFDDFVSNYLDELDSKATFGNKKAPIRQNQRPESQSFEDMLDDDASLDELLNSVSTPSKSVSLGSGAAVPRMEDFATFELYLKALVDFEQGKDSTKMTSKWASGKFTGGQGGSDSKGLWDDDLEDLLLESSGDGDRKTASASKQAMISTGSKPSAKAPSSSGESLTIKDLKQQLRDRGLPVSGTKAELMARLDTSE